MFWLAKDLFLPLSFLRNPNLDKTYIITLIKYNNVKKNLITLGLHQ